jgi:hypothetical protein
MNNFADDEFLKEEPPAAEPAPEKTSRPEPEERDEDRFLNRKWVRIPLRVGIGLWILGTALGIYWNRRPETFKVEQMATAMAITEGHREEGQPLPMGYRFVSTLVHLMENTFLGKPGGMMSNDWNPVSRITDNMRSWERGFIVQYRVMVQALRFDLSRIGPQSQDHVQLQNADPLFNFKETSWALPASEQQYKDGLDELKSFLAAMAASESEAAYFAARQDQLINYLARQTVMLGDYTSKLQRNIGGQTYDTGVLTSTQGEMNADGSTPLPSATQEANTFWTRDNAFYEVRGGVYVMYHCMLAIRKDCETLINDAKAMGVMNRILNELESANKPMGSPMVLNGKEFGVLQNHSLVLASHLAKAHLAVQELQLQLRGGGRI